MVSTCLNHRFTHSHFPSHLRLPALTLEALPDYRAPSQQQVVGEAQRLLLVELEMFRLWRLPPLKWVTRSDQSVSNISNHWQFSPAQLVITQESGTLGSNIRSVEVMYVFLCSNFCFASQNNHLKKIKWSLNVPESS